MVVGHDFKRFPELTNSQMEFYYFDSPHRQIVEDFNAKIIKVTDGDTVRVAWTERKFDFPVRMANIAAPELGEEGGRKAQRWLQNQILGKDVEILIDPRNRVGKWGRIIGEIISQGRNLNEESIEIGYSKPFGSIDEGLIPNFNSELDNL